MPSQLTDYRKISTALIATVFNESKNINDFLESYKRQSILAQELIIVDAFSEDGTDLLIEEFGRRNPHLRIRLFRKKSNRSQARNFAVNQTKADYLVFTDAGCVLDWLWLEELLKKLILSQKKVIGGFFGGIVHSELEEAIVPYFLQLPKNVSEKNFIPTTRSLLIEKKFWQEMGGLNESLKLSEDYQLMLRIKKRKIPIAFAKKAIVYWEPPHSFMAFIQKISSFARSDVEAGIIRPKVLLIFARYLFFLILLLNFNLIYFLGLFFIYMMWSIYKNKHNCPRSWYLLPILQVSSDFVVMVASLLTMPKFNSRAL